MHLHSLSAVDFLSFVSLYLISISYDWFIRSNFNHAEITKEFENVDFAKVMKFE